MTQQQQQQDYIDALEEVAVIKSDIKKVITVAYGFFKMLNIPVASLKNFDSGTLVELMPMVIPTLMSGGLDFASIKGVGDIIPIMEKYAALAEDIIPQPEK